MRLDLVEVPADDPALLELGQLYQYDFTEFIDAHAGPDGRFDFIDLTRPGRRSFLFRVDAHPAGFAIVSRTQALHDPEQRVWWMDEFFVMKRSRRRGIGARFARELFDRFPGTWEVGQVLSNTPAQAFWREVIGRYTGGNYEEVELDDERWWGPVQCFRSEDAP